MIECPRCEGSGLSEDDIDADCERCGGAGVIEGSEYRAEVEVDRWVDDCRNGF